MPCSASFSCSPVSFERNSRKLASPGKTVSPQAASPSDKNLRSSAMRLAVSAAQSGSFAAAAAHACAMTDTFHGCPAWYNFSISAASAVMHQPKRTPGTAYIFVYARRIIRPGLDSSRSFRVCRSASVRKSLKHSSTTSFTPFSVHFRTISRRSSGWAVRPVGLFGLQRYTASKSGEISSKMRSVSAKPSVSRRLCTRISAPESVRSYSAKVGAVRSTLRGFSTAANRSSTSAAPLPQYRKSGLTPSLAPIACRAARQNGSGYCVQLSTALCMAARTASGMPNGLMFADRSSGAKPWRSM